MRWRGGMWKAMRCSTEAAQIATCYSVASLASCSRGTGGDPSRSQSEVLATTSSLNESSSAADAMAVGYGAATDRSTFDGLTFEYNPAVVVSARLGVARSTDISTKPSATSGAWTIQTSGLRRAAADGRTDTGADGSLWTR